MTGTPSAGAVLRRLRDRRRWSQERAALEADLDHSLVSRIESGRRLLTPYALTRVAEGWPLTRAERDELALAAGLAPLDPAAMLRDEPVVVALYRYLHDSGAPARDRLRAREIVRLLVSQSEYPGGVEPAEPVAHMEAVADD